MLNGGSNFVTERFLEKSGFSFEITGANRKRKQRAIKNASEKVTLLFTLNNLFLNNNIKGIVRRKRMVDAAASIKLRFRTASALPVSVASNSI
jgi:hypothetical protein